MALGGGGGGGGGGGVGGDSGGGDGRAQKITPPTAKLFTPLAAIKSSFIELNTGGRYLLGPRGRRRGARRVPCDGGAGVRQGLTLVHFSAQLERVVFDRGCA